MVRLPIPFAPHIPSQEARYATVEIKEWAGNPAVLEEDLTDKPPFMQDGGTTLADGQELRANQLRTLMSVDDLVQGMFDEMESLGETEETLAIFMSDNGSLWGEHGFEGQDKLV